MNRRMFLTTALVAPTALAGCKALNTIAGVDMSTVANDVHTVAGLIGTVKNTIDGLSLVPQSVKDKIDALYNDGLAAAKNAVAAVSNVASQPFVVSLEADLKSAFDFAKGYLPTTSSGALNDGLLLLSIVKNAIGLVPLLAMAPAPEQVAAARTRSQALVARGRL